MSSLEKAIEILTCFSPERPALGVSEIAGELGMPKSSVSRMMKAMAEGGLLEQDRGTRAYVVGVLAFQLGNLYHGNLAVQGFVDEALGDLVERFGLTGYVGVLNGTEVVLIGVRQGSYPVRMVMATGTRVTAHTTALGLALLSRLADEDLRRLYPADVTFREANVTLTGKEILSSIETVRKLGYATVEGTSRKGFSAVAVAVDSVRERQCLAYGLSYPHELLATYDFGELTEAIVSSAHATGKRIADPYWVGRGPQVDHSRPVEMVLKGESP